MNMIETRHLTKHYGSKIAVNDLSLTVREGELFSLLGVNGAMVKAHGSSSPLAFKNAIRQARLMVEKDVTGTIRAGLEAMMGN